MGFVKRDSVALVLPLALVALLLRSTNPNSTWNEAVSCLILQAQGRDGASTHLFRAPLFVKHAHAAA